MSQTCVGIDLGTSNTCASAFRNGECKTVLLDGTNYLMPSVYSLDMEYHDVFGKVAKRRSNVNHYFTVKNFKRVIGIPFNSPRVRNDPFLCGITMKEGDDGGVVFCKEGFKCTLSPVEVTAKILSKVKKELEVRTGCQIGFATITYPVGFSAKQLEDTKKAALMAGFKEGSFTLIDESSASAIRYIAQENDFSGNLVMFDIGGGTFDATVVSVKDGHISIRNHIGDEGFGGLAIDKKIADFVDNECYEMHEFHVVDSTHRNALTHYNQFMGECETAKKQLTGADSYTFFITPPSHDQEEVTFNLMQSHVEVLIGNDIDSCVSLMEKAILQCGLTKDDINAVVLIGGTCRLPFVKTKLNKYFQRDVVKENINPDDAVCIGACHYSCGWKNNKDKPTFTMYGKELVIDQTLMENIMMDLGGAELHVVIPRGVPIEQKAYHVCLDAPNTKVKEIRTIVYAGNSQKREESVVLREITWSGFPAERNYILHFVLFVTLLGDRCISVRVEDRVNKKVYFPETRIDFSAVCHK